MPLNKFKEKEAHPPRRLSLSLVITQKCNLNCLYCYENKSERNTKQMDFSTAKDVITYYMKRDDGFENVSIEFFGGEPMLAFQLIKKIVEWYNTQAWQKSAFFAILTNGTILTKEMKEWLIKYKKQFTVGFSIDGCKEAHDLNRSNSYDLVYKNIPFFKKNWPHQPAKATFNDNSFPYIAESIIHLESIGLNFNGGLVLEDIWGDSERKMKLLNLYEDQLAKLIDFYANKTDLFPPVPLFVKIPEYISNSEEELNKLKKTTTRFCGAGHEMVTIDVDGTSYPCHRFLPICTGRKAPDNPVNRQTAWDSDKCNKCKILPSCPTCIGFNYQENEDTSVRTTYHCEAYRLGIMASCQLESVRLNQLKEHELSLLPEEEKNKIRVRLDSILNIIEKGLDIP